MNNLITSIPRNINLSDIELNVIIQAYLDGEFYTGEIISVEQWRLNNYLDLRRWAYPKTTEFYDSQVKINSGINELITEGYIQLEKYVQDCLNVKTRFPKE